MIKNILKYQKILIFISSDALNVKNRFASKYHFRLVWSHPISENLKLPQSSFAMIYFNPAIAVLFFYTYFYRYHHSVTTK